MMRRMLGNLLVMVLILALALPVTVEAARGVPGSADFGIGAAIHPDGAYLAEALEIAAPLDLDWISIPFVWSTSQPDPSQSPQVENLDRVMYFAGEHDVAVLISITSAPDWAKTQRGPNPEQTVQLITWLIQRYPETLQAVELFPGANTRDGWGAEADAQSYTALLAAAANSLRESGGQVLPVAGGLRPVVGNPSKGDVADLQFLKELYAQGVMAFMPVLSVQFTDLTGVPLSFPSSNGYPVLRHYEEIRRIMTANGHKNGLIWITRLCPPSGTIEASDSVYQDMNMQSNWLSLAYIQLRSQLYVGVTIGQSLNPESGGASAGFPSMLGGESRIHPFYSVLREMISLNKTGSVSIMPGKPKEGNLEKKRP